MIRSFYRSRVLILVISIIPLLSIASEKLNHTVLHLEFNTGNPAPYGLPSTVISIQGKSLPVIFDTGAYRSDITLSAHALKGLHVRFTGKSICFKAFDGKHCEKEFVVPALKIGNFTVNDVKGTLMPKLWGGHNKGFTGSEASRNGVIGYGLLSKFNILLDYSHSQAIFVKKDTKLKNYNMDKWIPIQFQKHLITHLKLNGNSMVIGWDTGSIPSVIKESSVKMMKKIPCPKDRPYSDKKCSRVWTQLLVTQSGRSLPNTWFKVENIPSYAPFDGLMGSNFYRNNLVYFDFKNHYIYIQH